MTATNPLGPWTGSAVPTNPYWQVENGALNATQGTGIANMGFAWTNYTFSAAVTPLKTGKLGTTAYAQAGLTFRASNVSDGYTFLLSNYPYTSADAGGYVAFLKNGSLVSTAALPFAIIGGDTYQVAITTRGNTFTISVNGTKVDSVTDSTYSSGTIGFREYGGNSESANFDNVDVTSSSGTVLFTDTFSSSSLSQWIAPSPAVKPYYINSNSCGGQPSFVATLVQAGGGTIYLFGSDLWDGSHNEALANFFWSPLAFNSDGSIQKITCSASVQLNLANRQAGSQQPIPGVDQADGVSDFYTFCDIGDASGAVERMQTFTPSATKLLTSVAITTFQEGSPNAALKVDIVSLNASDQPTSTLRTTSVAVSSIGWSAHNVVIHPNIPVTAGQQYGIVLHSSTTMGCYGMAYNDSDLYTRGKELYSSKTRSSFSVESHRALKIFTTLNDAIGPTPRPVVGDHPERGLAQQLPFFAGSYQSAICDRPCCFRNCACSFCNCTISSVQNPLIRLKSIARMLVCVRNGTAWIANYCGSLLRGAIVTRLVMIMATIQKITVGRAVMVDGNFHLSERQKRALVAHQFKLQMPKYPFKILDQLTNYRYQMYDEKLEVELLATTLASSFDFYEYRMNLRGGISLIVCQKHNTALPVRCLELETEILYDPGIGPELERANKREQGKRKRRTHDEQRLFISQLILGVDIAHEELLNLDPRTQQRYLVLRQKYLKTKPGRPWVS